MRSIISINYLKDTESLIMDLWWGDIRVLFDSGASVPLWIKSEEELKDIGGKYTGKSYGVRGIGGRVSGCKLYKIDWFVFGNLIFKDLPVLILHLPKDKEKEEEREEEKEETSISMLLPNVMLKNMIYEVDDKKKVFTITVPDDEMIFRKMILHTAEDKITSVETIGIEETSLKLDLLRKRIRIYLKDKADISKNNSSYINSLRDKVLELDRYISGLQDSAKPVSAIKSDELDEALVAAFRDFYSKKL